VGSGTVMAEREGDEDGCDVSGPAQVKRMRAGRDEVGLREEILC